MGIRNARPKRRLQVPTHAEAQYKRDTKSTVRTENFPEFFHALESLHQAFKTQENVYIKFINNVQSFQEYY